MPTIKEIAGLAGVSPATVSRVINGTARVDVGTKKRVQDVIDENSYRPNAVARSLYTKSSRIIGLIVPDIKNPFFNELAGVIEETAHKKGYTIMLNNTNNDEAKEEQSIEVVTSMNADGIILITNNERTAERIDRCDLPVVVVDRHVSESGEAAHIESDHYEGGRIATEHLIKKGCRNIVCLRGPQEFASGRLRFRGYQDAMDAAGLKQMFIDTKYNFESGLLAAEEMMRKYPQVDGVFAANDMVAISTYKVVSAAGARVPDNIRIIGFDDISISTLVTPSLSTIRQPVSEMGKRATEILISCINGEKFPRDNVFDVELIERETT